MEDNLYIKVNRAEKSQLMFSTHNIIVSISISATYLSGKDVESSLAYYSLSTELIVRTKSSGVGTVGGNSIDFLLWIMLCRG